MSEGRPHLVAVAGDAQRPAAARSRRPRHLTALLVALSLVCAAGWGLTRRQVTRLESELAASQQALAEASATLAASEAQRSEVRTQLNALSAEAAGLASRLDALETFVATDPARAADAQAMRSEAPPSE